MHWKTQYIFHVKILVARQNWIFTYSALIKKFERPFERSGKVFRQFLKPRKWENHVLRCKNKLDRPTPTTQLKQEQNLNLHTNLSVPKVINYLQDVGREIGNVLENFISYKTDR